MCLYTTAEVNLTFWFKGRDRLRRTIKSEGLKSEHKTWCFVVSHELCNRIIECLVPNLQFEKQSLDEIIHSDYFTNVLVQGSVLFLGSFQEIYESKNTNLKVMLQLRFITGLIRHMSLFQFTTCDVPFFNISHGFNAFPNRLNNVICSLNEPATFLPSR